MTTQPQLQAGFGDREEESHLAGVATPRGVAVELGDLARTLRAHSEPQPILSDMVTAAMNLVPGVDDGSISLVTRGKKVQSLAFHSELSRRVDAVQLALGEGPCLEAIFLEPMVHVPDMQTEDRWPVFAAKAHLMGVGSMLAFRLYVKDDSLGALNLFARAPHAFTEESVHNGWLVAAHASVAYADAQKVEQLGEALGTRDLIGQAKGILMERFKITGQQAFVVLTRASSESNIKLRDVAERLVASGELPPRTPARRNL